MQSAPDQKELKDGEPDTRMVKPDIELPDDFSTEQEFLTHMRKEFTDDVLFDKMNRDAGIEDQRFMVGEQWDDLVRAKREAAFKPVLTTNRLPAFVGQVVGTRRLSETTIKIIPDNGGTVAVARVREGLLRSVQKTSRADIAYDKALECSVTCGMGNFMLELDWSTDDVWVQDMKIVPLPDPWSVVWDRMLVNPTGKDADHVSVVDTMKQKAFAKRWPWARPSDVSIDATLSGELRMNGWVAIDDIRVVSYWRMRTRKRMLAFMTDGSTQDITDDVQGNLANIQQRADGSPIMREVKLKYAQMYICTGLDILEGPYNLPISRLPVFRVPGWEINVGQFKHRWGLIRFLKDPQRLHNYSRSVVAEKMMQTPRAVWTASDTAVSGREAAWRDSHKSDDSLLIWNAESGNKPERVAPAQIEQSWLGMAEITSQDIKDVSNIHEANLGMPSNEVSGVAINARQRVSDTGTVLYHDNLGMAIEECGLVANELIPIVYDTPRIIRVLGEDAQQDLQIINTMGNPKSIDITIGKYSVSVTTGASYATKRIEAAANMMNLATAMPEALAVSADLIVEAQDWPMAEKISRRLKMQLPPGMLDEKDMTPELKAQQASQQQQQQAKSKMDFATAMADYLKTQSETTLNTARAHKFAVDADLAPSHVNTQAMAEASQASDRELRGHLEVIKTADGQ